MNKDALLATLIGFIIGVMITGGLLFGPKVIRALPHFNLPKISFALPGTAKTTVKNGTPTKKVVNISPDKLSVLSPLPDSLANSDTLLVSGTAPEGSYMTIGSFIDEDAAIVTDGKYAGKVTLGEGRNDITVNAFTGDKILSQTVTVYYTPEKF